MDRFEPLTLSIEQQPSELKINNSKLNKRGTKKRKAGVTKKDKLSLKRWENKIIALNKKLNEQIKKRKSCKKQPLEKTLANAKNLRLTKRKRKARKQSVEEEVVPEPEIYPNQVQEPEVVQEDELQTPVESSVEQPEVEKPNVLSSVTDSVSSAAESAAESIGLVKPKEEEEKKEGGRQTRMGKKGKNSKRTR